MEVWRRLLGERRLARRLVEASGMKKLAWCPAQEAEVVLACDHWSRRRSVDSV